MHWTEEKHQKKPSSESQDLNPSVDCSRKKLEADKNGDSCRLEKGAKKYEDSTKDGQYHKAYKGDSSSGNWRKRMIKQSTLKSSNEGLCFRGRILQDRMLRSIRYACDGFCGGEIWVLSIQSRAGSSFSAVGAYENERKPLLG